MPFDRDVIDLTDALYFVQRKRKIYVNKYTLLSNKRYKKLLK